MQDIRGILARTLLLLMSRTTIKVASCAGFLLVGHLAFADNTVPPDWTYSVEKGNWVNSVSISSQGQVVLAASCELAVDQPSNYQVVALDYKGGAKWIDHLNNVYRGVFWTALSRDGAYGAVGGLYSNAPNYHGFIRAYNMATGEQLLNDMSTESRVNVVALSKDGARLIAADGGQLSKKAALRLYKLDKASSPQKYSLVDIYNTGSQSIGSAAMSQDGEWIIIGEGGSVGYGMVSLFQVVNDKLNLVKTWTAPAGVIYIQAVDISDAGDVFAAALPNQTAVIFQRQSFIANGKPSWTVSTDHGCGGHTVYGLRMFPSGQGIATGTNCANDGAGGYVDVFQIPPANNPPKALWSQHTDRPPNAGMGVDGKASLLSFADGHPVGTPGNFYLFDAVTGVMRWKYQTPNMNWGDAVSENGDAVVGGGDDGKVYFWNLDKHATVVGKIDPNRFKQRPKIPKWEWPMDMRNLNKKIQANEQYTR